VLHLAALIAIPYSYAAPKSYIETNIIGTLNVLQAARELNLSRVVHTSTSEVYGSAVYVPINEDHRVLGQSPYSASKIGADQLAYSFFTSYEVPVVTLRPFNTFGPRQSMRAVIPSIIKQLVDGNSNLKLGALKPTRNFNFVEDTVAGFIAALNSGGCEGETINIGSNYEISIGDLALLLGKIAKIEVNIIEDGHRIRPNDSEVWRLAADGGKARKLLNWQPEYVGIDGFSLALERTFQWFSCASNRALYQSGNYNL
jgi:dTDP-glucose 4,6-dehydratase